MGIKEGDWEEICSNLLKWLEKEVELATLTNKDMVFKGTIHVPNEIPIELEPDPVVSDLLKDHYVSLRKKELKSLRSFANDFGEFIDIPMNYNSNDKLLMFIGDIFNLIEGLGKLPYEKGKKYFLAMYLEFQKNFLTT